jgi:hypothetical protein
MDLDVIEDGDLNEIYAGPKAYAEHCELIANHPPTLEKMWSTLLTFTSLTNMEIHPVKTFYAHNSHAADAGIAAAVHTSDKKDKKPLPFRGPQGRFEILGILPTLFPKSSPKKGPKTYKNVSEP